MNAPTKLVVFAVIGAGGLTLALAQDRAAGSSRTAQPTPSIKQGKFGPKVVYKPIVVVKSSTSATPSPLLLAKARTAQAAPAPEPGKAAAGKLLTDLGESNNLVFTGEDFWLHVASPTEALSGVEVRMYLLDTHYSSGQFLSGSGVSAASWLKSDTGYFAGSLSDQAVGADWGTMFRVQIDQSLLDEEDGNHSQLMFVIGKPDSEMEYCATMTFDVVQGVKRDAAGAPNKAAEVAK